MGMTKQEFMQAYEDGLAKKKQALMKSKKDAEQFIIENCCRQVLKYAKKDTYR